MADQVVVFEIPEVQKCIVVRGTFLLGSERNSAGDPPEQPVLIAAE